MQNLFNLGNNSIRDGGSHGISSGRETIVVGEDVFIETSPMEKHKKCFILINR